MNETLEPVEFHSTRTDYCIKLYKSNDISRCNAILFTGLTWDTAESLYDRINEALGHQRNGEGELVVLGGTLPYVLID